MGVGGLAGSVLATRARPARPLVVVAAMEGLFGLPLAFLAAGHPRRFWPSALSSPGSA